MTILIIGGGTLWVLLLIYGLGKSYDRSVQRRLNRQLIQAIRNPNAGPTRAFVGPRLNDPLLRKFLFVVAVIGIVIMLAFLSHGTTPA